MIITFGPVPEVPVGRKVYNRHNHKLVVNSLGGKTRDPWGDEVLAPLYRSIEPNDLVAADVVYVLVSEVGEWCTRADSRFLLDWIVGRRSGRGGVKVVTNFRQLDRYGREKEQSELAGLAVAVIEVDDRYGETFFQNIVRKYAMAVA